MERIPAEVFTGLLDSDDPDVVSADIMICRLNDAKDIFELDTDIHQILQRYGICTIVACVDRATLALRTELAVRIPMDQGKSLKNDLREHNHVALYELKTVCDSSSNLEWLFISVTPKGRTKI